MEKYPLITISRSSIAAIPAFRFVRPSNNTAVSPASAATDALIGVTTELGIDAGKIGDVVTHGLYPIRAGAAIAAGALLTSDSVGRAVTASSGNRVGAIALTAATAADQIVYATLAQSVA